MGFSGLSSWSNKGLICPGIDFKMIDRGLLSYFESMCRGKKKELFAGVLLRFSSEKKGLLQLFKYKFIGFIA